MVVGGIITARIGFTIVVKFMVHICNQLYIAVFTFYDEHDGIGISIGLVAREGNGIASVVFLDRDQLASYFFLYLSFCWRINQRISLQ